MQEIEDQTHSLFSSLVRASHSSIAFEFEGEQYSVGLGPLKNDLHGNSFIDLTGSCSILGFGHPLLYKSHLKAAMSGSMFAPCEEIEIFLIEWNQFLNKLGFPPKNWGIQKSGSSPNFCGWYPNFFENGLESSVDSLFPFSLIQNGNIGKVSTAELFLAKDLLRLLSDGYFYGENGIIKHRSEVLKRHLEKMPWFKEINGLIVNLKEGTTFATDKVRFLNDRLVFPSSFDEDDLVTILNELEK